MKQNLSKLFVITICGLILQGCVAFPPLIQVEKKESNDTELARRVDAMEKQLNRIEEKLDKK